MVPIVHQKYPENVYISYFYQRLPYILYILRKYFQPLTDERWKRSWDEWFLIVKEAHEKSSTAASKNMQAQMQLMEKRYACQKITFKT
jgi:hypothetical protein